MSRPVPPRTEDTPEAVRAYYRAVDDARDTYELDRPQRGEE